MCRRQSITPARPFEVGQNLSILNGCEQRLDLAVELGFEPRTHCTEDEFIKHCAKIIVTSKRVSMVSIKPNNMVSTYLVSMAIYDHFWSQLEMVECAW